MDIQEVKEQVEKALDEIRPYLLNDGGNLSLVSIDEDLTVKIRLEGNCVSCRINHMTMKLGVEETIKKHVPQIKEVISVE